MNEDRVASIKETVKENSNAKNGEVEALKQLNVRKLKSMTKVDID